MTHHKTLSLCSSFPFHFYSFANRFLFISALPHTLKPNDCHNTDFVVNGSTADCHNNSLQCRQWRQSWHYDDSRVMYVFPSVDGGSAVVMSSSNGNIFRVTGPLCGEFTGFRGIPHHKGQWHGALVFSMICAWTNGWVNNRDAGDLRRHRALHDVTVMLFHVYRRGGAWW